jgi:hypothetical protein
MVDWRDVLRYGSPSKTEGTQAMARMNTDEGDLIRKAQVAARLAKKELQNLANALTALMPVTEAAGGKKAANAAMRFRGAALQARGIIDSAHADASDSLIDLFDDGGEIVVFGGGR